MCPKSVVTSRDTETSGEVVCDREDCCLPHHWCPDGLDASHKGHADDESHIEPVDMLVPI